MYCVRCGKVINNPNGQCDSCIDESNDIFVDDGLGNQEPLFNDLDDTQTLGGFSNNLSNEGRRVNEERQRVENSKVELNKENNERGNFNNQNQSRDFNNGQNYNNQPCKYCVGCGSRLHVMARTCPQCGVEAGPLNDEGNLMLGGLACCIPVVGWIMYFIYRETKPKTAKHALVGGILSFVIWFLLYLVLIFGMFSSFYYYF